MDEANEFFDRYFASAPRLKRAHIEAYKAHARGTWVPAGPKGSREDGLPLPPPPSPPPQSPADLEPLPAGARVWKIAPDKDAKEWSAWERQIGEDGEGFVAMGWNASVGGHAAKTSQKDLALPCDAREQCSMSDCTTSRRSRASTWSIAPSQIDNGKGTGDEFLARAHRAEIEHRDTPCQRTSCGASRLETAGSCIWWARLPQPISRSPAARPKPSTKAGWMRSS